MAIKAAKPMLDLDKGVELQPATQRLVARRRKERESFVQALRQPSLERELEHDEVFSALVGLAVYDYGVPQKDLASTLKVDPSAITRWAKGETAPRLYTRSLIVSGIAGILDKQLLAE